jgi:dTDP-4-amino-4,6-dideoxygalactose transaminase
MCNATIGLAIASRALNLQHEVIVPAYTFVSTAHVFRWQQTRPVFVDMDPNTHNIDPEAISRAITENTSAIVGVHVWGRPCDTVSIEKIAQAHQLPVLYDAAHAFGCSNLGKRIGNFGVCEVFSFHATKFLNSFEGGAVVCEDDELANKLRLMRNFGFAGYDRVVELGLNGKMTEICAAMGITSLEVIDQLIAKNKQNYECYCEQLANLPGFKMVQYSEKDVNNYQYIVVEVDPTVCPLDRDDLVKVLHAENILARKYFWPGAHRMEPYLAEQPDAWKQVPHTERVAPRVMVLPNGEGIDEQAIALIASVLDRAVGDSGRVRQAIHDRR